MFFTRIPLVSLRKQLSLQNLIISQHVSWLHSWKYQQKGSETKTYSHPSATVLSLSLYLSLSLFLSLSHSLSVCLSLYAAFSAPPS